MPVESTPATRLTRVDLGATPTIVGSVAVGTEQRLRRRPHGRRGGAGRGALPPRPARFRVPVGQRPGRHRPGHSRQSPGDHREHHRRLAAHDDRRGRRPGGDDHPGRRLRGGRPPDGVRRLRRGHRRRARPRRRRRRPPAVGRGGRGRPDGLRLDPGALPGHHPLAVVRHAGRRGHHHGPRCPSRSSRSAPTCTPSPCPPTPPPATRPPARCRASCSGSSPCPSTTATSGWPRPPLRPRSPSPCRWPSRTVSPRPKPSRR